MHNNRLIKSMEEEEHVENCWTRLIACHRSRRENKTEASAEEREKLETQKLVAERMTAVDQASALSMLQIYIMQGQIDNLQRHLFRVHNHEVALETRLVWGFTHISPRKSPMGPTRIKRTFQVAGVSLLLRHNFILLVNFNWLNWLNWV